MGWWLGCAGEEEPNGNACEVSLAVDRDNDESVEVVVHHQDPTRERERDGAWLDHDNWVGPRANQREGGPDD